MHLWLTMDPETRRVSAYPWPHEENHRPPGPRGAGWPLREIEVDDEVWFAMKTGTTEPDEQDRLHRSWWDEAGGLPWPLLEGRVAAHG